jgi:hypothetical protein
VTDSTDQHNSDESAEPKVLHVIVGHGLRTYFLNAVRSVRTVAPGDDILIVDNASPDPALRSDLAAIVAEDPRMRLILRDSNDLVNGKVGGLYDAYRDAFAVALREDYDYVHLVQSDMQVLWWDSDVMSRAADVYERNPRCVNIFTCLFSIDRRFDEGLKGAGSGEPPVMDNFGLTDTGLYHLGRWKEFDMFWDNDELEHGNRYLAEGFSVICHPWPTDAQIPWPAVVRKGVQRGREITPMKPFLLKPLTPAQVDQLRAREWTWLEDVCVPWGWTCLTPMWTTHLNADYLANRRQSLSRLGLRKGFPGWEREGLDDKSWRATLLSQHRPSLWALLVGVPLTEARSRIKTRLRNKTDF